MQTAIDHEEIARQGEELYERDIRSRVESARRGEFIVLDVDSGDFEIDADEVKAVRRMMDRKPDGRRYIKRIGYAATHRLGGRIVPRQP